MTNIATTLTADATLQRTRLLLGLTNGHAVVAWADACILALDDPPAALLDVSGIEPTDLSALRHALLPLCAEPVDAQTVLVIVREVAAAVVSGQRNAADTAHVFRQMRRMLPLPTRTDHELDALVDTLMLAEAGIGVSVAEAEAGIHRWAQAQHRST